MSHKSAFIRATAPLMLLAQLLRQEAKGDPARAIAWAESLWDRLCEAGYGPPQTRGPRPLTDHLAALSPEQADSFSRLWAAYAHPKGKQAAAQAWGQIAPGPDLAKLIIAAAEAESREPRQEGAVRKWLQGWLTERRWEDKPVLVGAASAATPNAAIDARRQEVAELLGERARLLLILRLDPSDPNAQALLSDLDTRLRAQGIDPGAKAAPKRRSGPSPVAGLLRPPRPQPEDTP